MEPGTISLFLTLPSLKELTEPAEEPPASDTSGGTQLGEVKCAPCAVRGI